MDVDLADGVNQARFAALLRYFQRGDFSLFERLCELAFGARIASEPYCCANLLFAAQACGLCEATNSTGVIRWWVAHDKDIVIQSRRPKRIGAQLEWFERHGRQCEPLIMDAQSRPMIIGLLDPVTPSQSQRPLGLFSQSFASRVQPFKDIESQLCSRVTYNDNLSGDVFAYQPTRGAWEPANVRELRGSQLIRVRSEFGRVSYYAQHAELGIRLKIDQPEWAFVTAFHLFPWRQEDLFQIVGQSIQTWRAIRLPTLMYRWLFASAASLHIGPRITFEDVDPECIDGITSYFALVGERP